MRLHSCIGLAVMAVAPLTALAQSPTAARNHPPQTPLAASQGLDWALQASTLQWAAQSLGTQEPATAAATLQGLADQKWQAARWAMTGAPTGAVPAAASASGEPDLAAACAAYVRTLDQLCGQGRRINPADAAAILATDTAVADALAKWRFARFDAGSEHAATTQELGTLAVASQKQLGVTAAVPERTPTPAGAAAEGASVAALQRQGRQLIAMFARHGGTPASSRR